MGGSLTLNFIIFSLLRLQWIFAICNFFIYLLNLATKHFRCGGFNWEQREITHIQREKEKRAQSCMSQKCFWSLYCRNNDCKNEDYDEMNRNFFYMLSKYMCVRRSLDSGLLNKQTTIYMKFHKWGLTRI